MTSIKEQLDEIRNESFKQGIWQGKKERLKEVRIIINKYIKMWENNIKGKQERYYGVSGSILNQLEIIKQELEQLEKQ